MHEYDTVLKSLLTGSENSIFERITGARHGRWLNVELPDVTQTRVDLLFETSEEESSARRLIAMELQSTNDALLPLRMAEYSLRVYHLHKQFPEQYVLYVGSEEMSMLSALTGPNHICQYKIVDIRVWDADMLLSSPFPADTVIAILGRYSDRPEIIQRILTRIAKLETTGKGEALTKLLLLAGIRKLADEVRKEAKKMPILNDIMDHEVFGPLIRQGIEQGLEQGRRENGEKARQEALVILRRLITKRFGPIPPSSEDRLNKLSTAELEDLVDRCIDAPSLAALFDPA